MQYPNIAQPQYAFAPTMMAGGGAVDAENVRGQGRGRDSMLVHMSPREVSGLQALAMAHGGSLTINPKTGLPEAGFLESILPMVAGAALTATGVGAPMAALLVGGGTTLMTGDLGKGLMAGLGAFGGANLGAGLMEAGASTAGQVITPEVANATVLTPQVSADTLVARELANPYAAEGLRGSAASFYDPTVAAGAVPTSQAPAGIVRSYTPGFMDNIQQMGGGIKNLLSPDSASSAFQKLVGQAEQVDKEGNVIQKATGLGGNMGALKTAASVAAPFLFKEPEQPKMPEDKSMIRPYEFDYGRADEDEKFKYRTGSRGESTSELAYFNPRYTALEPYRAAGGGVVAFAEGGAASNAPSDAAGSNQAGIPVTASEADVYRNIAAVQALAGLPAIEVPMALSRPPMQVPVTPAPNYVFNPGKEIMYDVYRPKEEDSESYKVPQKKKKRVSLGGFGIVRPDNYAGGGLTALAKGGLRDGAFVVPADVVSHLGNGSNDAGQKILRARLGASPIKGKGDGMSDSIPTTIEGRQPARVADGEAYVPPEKVKKVGAKKLYAMMDKIRKDRTGTKKQAPEINAHRYVPA